MRIYVASSWRNELQPSVVELLRGHGHEVYDFRRPSSEDNGFSWREIGEGWLAWSPREFRMALRHPAATRGFQLDMDALNWAEATLLVLPCGKSAHLELGYAVGRGHRTAVYMPAASEPELMYRMVGAILISERELADWSESIDGTSKP